MDLNSGSEGLGSILNQGTRRLSMSKITNFEIYQVLLVQPDLWSLPRKTGAKTHIYYTKKGVSYSVMIKLI